MTSMPKWANYYKKHHLNHNTQSLKVLNLLLGEDNICSPTYTKIIFWVSWCVCVCMYLQRLIYACIYVYSTYWMHASHMTILVQEHLYKSHSKTRIHMYIYDPYLVLINILPIRMNKGLCRPGETEMGSISSGNCKQRHGIYTFSAIWSNQVLGGWALCHHIEQNALCSCLIILLFNYMWKYTYNKTVTEQVNYQSHSVNLWPTTSSDAHGIIKFEFVFIDHTCCLKHFPGFYTLNHLIFPLGPFATTGIIFELRLSSYDVKTQTHMLDQWQPSVKLQLLTL